MAKQSGLKVTVEGDLPEQALNQLVTAVQDAVRREVAKIDILGEYREQPQQGITGGDGRTGGIIYLPPDGAF